MPSDRPSYLRALAIPGVARALAPNLLGRLSLAMSGLALVLLVEQRTGSFALAGAVTAVFGVANVAATPVRARLVDRRGQTWPLAALAVAHAAALLAVLAVDGTAALVAIAILAGLSCPPLGASMRVVWSHATPAGGLRGRGLSLDAVAEETLFAAGPLAAAGLAAVAGPGAALAASAGCVVAGGLGFVTSARSRAVSAEALGRPAAGMPRPRSPLRSRGFGAVVVAMLAPGIALGAVEIAAPALGVAAGDPLLAGGLLALVAAASAVGGLAYGRVAAATALRARLLVVGCVLAAALIAGGLVGLPWLIGLLAVAGAAVAPLMIVGYVAADDLTEPAVRTEASSWVNTAVNLGAACGSLAVGAVVDAAGPGVGLAIAGAAAAACLLVAAPLVRR